jgi:hypothetical protein
MYIWMLLVNEGFKLMAAPSPSSRSRIRLSIGMINLVGWDSYQTGFDCYGWFRAREELLCAPVELVDDQGEHPFAEILSIVEAVSTAPKAPSLRDIPSVGHLLASDRLFTFKAKWTTEIRSQLDLNLRVENTGQLGWSKQPTGVPPIYLRTYGNILIAISERRYLMARDQDLTT